MLPFAEQINTISQICSVEAAETGSMQNLDEKLKFAIQMCNYDWPAAILSKCLSMSGINQGDPRQSLEGQCHLYLQVVE